jgi:hypothetical protein
MRSDNDNKASFNNIRLSSATISGQIDMTGASIDGDLDFESLQIGDTLFMRSDSENMASFNTVNLVQATVKGGIIMDGAVLTGDFVAQGLRAAGDVSMKQIATDSPLIMPFARIDGNLDLGGANLADLDLRGASIAGEMRLGDKDKTSMVGWLAPKGGTDFIDLRSARVGSLSDNKYSWPKHLFLDGFAFARLGGYMGDSGDEMVGRGAEWWDLHWARLDSDFSPSPYEQLAGAFTAVGDRDAANDIHYLEQVRSDENTTGWGSFLWSRLLRWGAGYGIGTYMFRALYWALAFAFVGAVILRFWVQGVRDLKHGFLWCFGASVTRLLPVLSLKKEFVDFFDDPKLNQFKPWQDFVFVALAVLGWVLGAVVIAAFATITHGS